MLAFGPWWNMSHLPPVCPLFLCNVCVADYHWYYWLWLYVIQEFETLNLEIKELKTSIETGRAQIQAAQETIVQLTEQDGRSKERVAEAKVNIYHVYPNINWEFFSSFNVWLQSHLKHDLCEYFMDSWRLCGGLSCAWINTVVDIIVSGLISFDGGFVLFFTFMLGIQPSAVGVNTQWSCNIMDNKS